MQHSQNINCDSIQPNFLIIGAAKAATTYLSSLLSRHAQAGIVKGKEPHFFSRDQVYQAGWSAYQSLFSHCQDKKAIGDASTSYSRIRHYPKVFERLLKHIPETRIIYMVRHPMERMVSAYVERLGTPGFGQVYSSVNHAVRQQPMIIDSSRYWEVFDAYRQSFDESRIKIVWFEDITQNTQGAYSDICRFLDIDDSVKVPAISQQNNRSQVETRIDKLNRSHVEIKTEWDPETYAWALDKIREDTENFLAYFDKPGDYWQL